MRRVIGKGRNRKGGRKSFSQLFMKRWEKERREGVREQWNRVKGMGRGIQKAR